MRSRRENTRKSEGTEPAQALAAGPQPRRTSPRKKAEPSFFNAPLQPQPLVQPVEQPVVRMEVQPEVVLLMAAFVDELHTHNAIELMKMRNQETEAQKAAEAAEKEQAEADKRWAAIGPSMYS